MTHKDESAIPTAQEISGNDRRNHYEEAARKALVRLLDEEHIKLEYLAMVCGTSHQALGKYKSGAAPLPLHVAAQIDNALGEPIFFSLYAAMVGRCA